ncbi:MAG: nicotinamide-nucleotide amidohydrolase family protein [Methanomassiliicoccales archaeon]|jgi:nicotinamide-nucleotide amidase|nr:nicotinamide-nucleotide amidohydrolase family protein [Methanomassiliicoccales archaeon]
MTLPSRVGKALRDQGLKLALAESLTGGLVAAMVTEVPGSSDYFLLGVAAYSNRSKVEVLGVSESTLRSHGAVSAECAREMASGVRRASGADIGASCTGIAGPGGATATKPVGLVYLGVDDGRRALVEERRFEGDRSQVRRAAAERLLELILLDLEP